MCGYDTDSVTQAGATTNLRLPSQSQSTATAPWLVIIYHPSDGRRPSWPVWLVWHSIGTTGLQFWGKGRPL